MLTPSLPTERVTTGWVKYCIRRVLARDVTTHRAAASTVTRMPRALSPPATTN